MIKFFKFFNLFIFLWTTSFVSCFRIVKHSESSAQEIFIKGLERRGAFLEICQYIKKNGENSAISKFYSGKCKEKLMSITDDERYRKRLEEEIHMSYVKGAECGDTKSIASLSQLNIEIPEVEYEVGDLSFYPATLNRSCGLEAKITPIGWISTPVVVPLAVAGAAVVLAVTVVGLGVCVVVAPFVRGRCM